MILDVGEWWGWATCKGRKPQAYVEVAVKTLTCQGAQSHGTQPAEQG